MSILIRAWPNKLGWDVLDSAEREVGEIWSLFDGRWGVRTFDAGVPHKALAVFPVRDGGLFPLTHEEAYQRCVERGELIE